MADKRWRELGRVELARALGGLGHVASRDEKPKLGRRVSARIEDMMISVMGAVHLRMSM